MVCLPPRVVAHTVNWRFVARNRATISPCSDNRAKSARQTEHRRIEPFDGMGTLVTTWNFTVKI